MEEIHSFPQTFLPDKPTLEAYPKVWTQKYGQRATVNSLIIAVSTMIITTVLSTLAGYGFSRFRFRFDTWVFAAILGLRLLPPITMIIPVFKIFLSLRLLDTLIAIIFAHVYLTLPIMVWVSRNFFVNIPTELDESARIDGCTKFQALYTVILPMAAPGIATVAVLTFLFSWKEFLFAFVLSTEKAITAPVAGQLMVGDVLVYWNELTAWGMIAAGPAILFVLLFQRYITSGLTQGAIK